MLSYILPFVLLDIVRIINQIMGNSEFNDDEFIEKSRLHNDKWLKIVSGELKDIGLKISQTPKGFNLHPKNSVPVKGKSYSNVTADTSP